VTASTGTLTAASATGRSYQLGKVVFVQMDVVITTNGTGAVSLHVTLPVVPAPFNSALAGKSVNNDFIVAVDIVPADGNFAKIHGFDGTYPGFSGVEFVVTGVYEAA
jgi:hypothetical protein